MKISPDIQVKDWKKALLKSNKAHIPNFLEQDSAQKIFSALSEYNDWDVVFWKDKKRTKTSEKNIEAMSPVRLARFNQMIYSELKNGFQYCYKELPFSEVQNQDSHYSTFKELHDFINDPEFLDFARQSLQLPEIEFADMQITCYEKGHFLTMHNDDVKSQNRLASYVINLTPDWKPDWGGKLEFFDENQHVEQAFTPKFNALNIFKTPIAHAVSPVSFFCPASRYSISGWFRTK